GREPLGDPVIAESAFVRSLCVWVDEAASVRTCLHTIAAAKAVLLVYQHHPVWTDERGAHGTYLRAGGVSAVVAQLGNKEVLAALFPGGAKSILAAARRIHLGIFHLPVRDVVPLHPGPEIIVGNMV